MMTSPGKFTWTTYDTLLRLDFVSFAQRCLHELSPRAAFLMNWHIELLCAKLAALRAGRIGRLIINKAHDLDNIAFIFHPAVPRGSVCVSARYQGGMSRNVAEMISTRR